MILKTKQMELVIDSRETKILQVIEANPHLLPSYKYKKRIPRPCRLHSFRL